MTDASQSKVKFKIISGYRSFERQMIVYNNWVKIYGRKEANRISARPGYSEHQTGLAIDLGKTNGNCDLELCFANTAEGKWLASHAPEYGFIIRFPKGKENITGYQYEPWHIRYVGIPVAQKIKKTGQTLEEFTSSL